MTSIIRTVACAVSGGVDSAVSAYLLKQKGVYMTNWDPLDEDAACSSSVDRNDAQHICHQLGIEFQEVNFVKEYWNYVFLPLLDAYKHGFTPNPDILCNRFVKFDALFKCLRPEADRHRIDADALATGHYAQNSYGNFLQHRPASNNATSEPRLLRSVDPVKDQTFWLSTSMGICFIGKRSFSKFIDSYLEPTPGLFKDLETGLTLGEHRGIHHYTLGQKPGIPTTNGLSGPFYIVHRDYGGQQITVVRDPNHPALFMQYCWTSPAVWINSTPPQLPSTSISFQWQNKWCPVDCAIEPHRGVEQAEASFPFQSRFGSQIALPESDAGPCLGIRLTRPMRCVAPGQWAALYQGHKEQNIWLTHDGALVLSQTTNKALVRWVAGIHHYTLGQKPGIPTTNGLSGPFYIVHRDYGSQQITVVRDPNHPALFMQYCWTSPAVWINSTPPQLPSTSISFQWQNKWCPVDCAIEPHRGVEQAEASFPFQSRFGSQITLPESDAGPCLGIRLTRPMRCVAPGQWAALYQGSVCLGAAMIAGSISLWEEGRHSPYTEWDNASYELHY